MSLLQVAAPLVYFFSFCVFSVAPVQIYAPDCTLTTWQWTFNSLGQSPCTVIAYMMATCDAVDGVLSLEPLPTGYSYSGPDGPDDYDLCLCNTVAYSIYSACDACQGEEWVTWLDWVTNCTTILPPSSFPNAVPSGTRVPHWALLDVTIENSWDSNISYASGDSPELGPGAILGPLGVSYSVTPTSIVFPTFTGEPLPAPPSHRSNTAAIAGGVAGGVAVICLTAAVIFYLLRRSQAPSYAVPSGVGASQPQQTPSDGVVQSTLSESSNMKLYDPNNPATFPAYEGGHNTQDIPSQTYIPSVIGPGNNPDHTQPSLPYAGRYHGHPTV